LTRSASADFKRKRLARRANAKFSRPADASVETPCARPLSAQSGRSLAQGWKARHEDKNMKLSTVEQNDQNATKGVRPYPDMLDLAFAFERTKLEESGFP
jgi:hypothetical protein